MFKKLTTKEMLQNERLRSIQLDVNLKEENEQLLIQSAENTAETIESILILNEMQKVEQAESNTELIELMMMLQGGM